MGPGLVITPAAARGGDLVYLVRLVYVDRIVESAETLLKTPQIGRIVPEFTRPDLREVIFRWLTRSSRTRPP
jgi:hypothetical protein